MTRTFRDTKTKDQDQGRHMLGKRPLLLPAHASTGHSRAFRAQLFRIVVSVPSREGRVGGRDHGQCQHQHTAARRAGSSRTTS